MGQEDIEKMIADALDAAETSGADGRRPLAHGQHILDQYAALCGAGERPADPTAGDVLPVAAAAAAPAPTSTSPLASMVRRALARVKR
jgi:hypothetical protein